MFRALFPAFIFAAIVIAGCGGGGGSTTPATPAPGPSATASVGPSPATVTLAGGGYTLSFVVPAETTGSTSTMSAVLSTTLPTGVVAPSAIHMRSSKTLGTTTTGLVYLTVTSTAQVGFATAPSFTFTVPSPTTIPNGDPAYLLFYDPTASTTGWIALLGPATISGTTVSFPGVATGVNLRANTQYVYALAYTAQAVPTATPAPTPTPHATPAAYCANYATPAPNSNSSPQPVTFVDNSGTGARIYLYVVSGAASKTNPQTQYLAANGQMVNFTTGATAPPIPLECFPGSTGGTGLTFELPPPSIANQSGNLYVALATPGPGGTLPNPLTFQGTSNGGYNGPNLDWNAQLSGGGSAYVSTPYDYVEYTLPSGTTDVTQVDKVGLPLQLTQGSNTVGFAAGQYQNLLNGITADSTYKPLAVSGMLNGRSVLARILAPPNGEYFGFPQDWWYNNTFSPTYNALSKGYIGYLLSQYQTTPRLYTLNGTTQSGNYCATFDGVSNVQFYSVGSATSCSGLSGSPAYTMPINTTLEGTVNGTGAANTDSYGVCQSAVYRMPYGGPLGGSPLADLNEFYLWKAMVIDIARGVASQQPPATHPVGGWSTSPTVPVSFNSLFTDPVYNKYAYLVHKYMINNQSYALQYDEPGGLAPAFTSVPSQTLQITIQQIPTYSSTQPTALPTALPCP